jgi:hypothetical protein
MEQWSTDVVGPVTTDNFLITTTDEIEVLGSGVHQTKLYVRPGAPENNAVLRVAFQWLCDGLGLYI